MSFWQDLPKPIVGLAPMDGVTDAPYRYINAKYGKPDVIITEFISVDGIAYEAEKLYTDFLYDKNERPIVAQVFGINPEYFYIATKIICELGFDGIDVNMGCPAKSVSGRGAGAYLIKTPKLAQEILKACNQGVEDWVNTGLGDVKPKVLRAVENTKERIQELGGIITQERKEIPVSVKTRVGYDEIVIEEWIESLLDAKPKNITVHGRTLKQMYAGLADWDALKRGKQVVDKYNCDKKDEDKITYLGNGDVNVENLMQKINNSGVDGVLIGRGTFGNPWIFKDLKSIKNGSIKTQREISFEERSKVAIEHAQKHMEIKGEKAFVQMRKHLGWYIKGMYNAVDLRRSLMKVNSVEEIISIFDSYLDNLENNS